jgi:hypothetical protein
MGKNKKAAKDVPVWKPIAVISGIVIVVIILIFSVLYVANRPNYRDLEKEYKRISANIPPDWQLVSTSSNKGTWGLFCLQIEGSECPHVIYEYKLSASLNNHEKMLDSVQNIVVSSGLTLTNNSYQKCEEMNVVSGDYTCSSDGHTGSISVNVSLDGKDPNGNPGNWAFISISSYEK